MNGKMQIEGLMNELLGFAEKMLNEHGEFHPFGSYLKATGAVVHVGVQASQENRKSQKKVDALIESFKRLATQRKAIALGIAMDVKLPHADGSKGDSIKFLLEHQDGYCAEVFFCYEIAAGAVAITDVIAQQGENRFFKAAH